MNDFIVDPMFFYWLNVVGGIKEIFTIFAIIFSISTMIYIFYVFIEDIIENIIETESIITKTKKNSPKKHKKHKKHIIITAIVSIFFISTSILIPTKETLIQMEIAKQVTYSNIDKAEIKIKECIDYIFKKVKEL